MPRPPNPALQGPYDYMNGADVFGHPVNGFGRCQYLNANSGTGSDPPDITTQTNFMLGMPNDRLTEMAVNYGITVEPGTPNAETVPIIIAIIYPE